ncbi:recombinase family protein [Sulfurospirillum diekertiae]|uniref:Recombinase family protein n=1 Tax=Sulfurospirillum diekertiae TaxID=1854492 RepID=A0AA92FHE2_9BACT|nr:recombinase family protein [Sulfurospirillum diekertiae]QIR76110.1 recombinase family protein [Sulfurospirillum diekertiae]
MNIVLLKTRSNDSSMVVQQKQILKYAHHHDLEINTTEIENSDPALELEERKEFKGFLRSLSKHDHIIIFDLLTFSNNVEELVKIFECLLTRSISIHIADVNTCIHVDSKPLILLDLLVKQREFIKQLDKEKTQGRPKGRMSKSKFDIHRPYVIELLEKKTSISEISKILNVSRTSLKDYVNSRGLKELVKAKFSLLKSSKQQPLTLKSSVAKECSLIKQPVDYTEGTTHEL